MQEVFRIEICTSQPTCLPVVVLPPLGLAELGIDPPAGCAESLGHLSRAMANTGNAMAHSRTPSLDTGA